MLLPAPRRRSGLSVLGTPLSVGIQGTQDGSLCAPPPFCSVRVLQGPQGWPREALGKFSFLQEKCSVGVRKAKDRRSLLEVQTRNKFLPMLQAPKQLPDSSRHLSPASAGRLSVWASLQGFMGTEGIHLWEVLPVMEASRC